MYTGRLGFQLLASLRPQPSHRIWEFQKPGPDAENSKRRSRRCFCRIPGTCLGGQVPPEVCWTKTLKPTAVAMTRGVLKICQSLTLAKVSGINMQQAAARQPKYNNTTTFSIDIAALFRWTLLSMLACMEGWRPKE